MHTFSPKQKDAITNNLLISSISGKKYLQGNFTKSGRFSFPNIAAIKMRHDTKSNVFEIFNLLTIKWTYFPAARQQKEILSWVEKYYGDTDVDVEGGGYYINYLKDVFVYQEKLLAFDITYRIKTILKKAIGQENIKRIRKILKKHQ
jgi:hypothetical protein